MDHSTAPPLRKRTEICKFFRKLTNISFFNKQTNYGPINTKNGFPNQNKNTLNEVTGVPESNSIHSVDDEIENKKSATSLETIIQEHFPSNGSLPSLMEEKVEKLSIGMLTPDIISVDDATEDIFHTPSMSSIDGSAPSTASIQSIHSQDKKSDSFFSTLNKRDSRQASAPSESKSKCCCSCSVGKIVFFLLFIVAVITGAYYVKTHGVPGLTMKEDSNVELENPKNSKEEFQINSPIVTDSDGDNTDQKAEDVSHDFLNALLTNFVMTAQDYIKNEDD